MNKNSFFLFQEAQKNPNYAEMFRGRPLRFILPIHKNLDGKKNSESTLLMNGSIFIKPELLCSLGCETPRINYENCGIKYRYFYAISSDVDADNPGMVKKI